MWQNSATMKTQAVSSEDHDDAAHGHRSMVRFGPATVIEYIPTRKELWEEEQGDRLWWSRRDFEDFVHVTKFTGREIRRKGLADGISIAYQEVRQLVAQINEDILQQMIVDLPTDDVSHYVFINEPNMYLFRFLYSILLAINVLLVHVVS